MELMELQNVDTNQAVHDRELNSRRVGHKSDALSITPPSQVKMYISCNNTGLFSKCSKVVVAQKISC